MDPRGIPPDVLAAGLAELISECGPDTAVAAITAEQIGVAYRAMHGTDHPDAPTVTALTIVAINKLSAAIEPLTRGLDPRRSATGKSHDFEHAQLTLREALAALLAATSLNSLHLTGNADVISSPGK